ncbi:MULTISPECIES: ImmA/IrrE family metallo-endopeptidase [unclassified Rhizobium]|uniref:ImmA/IrrE family metallo-endopeptidase n=1 Tax=unclassified Rhizobium TaxID=2613769 RepID=UPI00115DE4AC|nr:MULTISPECIES: ImmA/IrrE family metallo-endopeptidase [unclassified Rhizobium]TQX88450.1 ImmA/IrrE family metallo-endopeptidase [Rhizobium sp. rho-13.1]TQY12645.1 ImmA/IrrE family metallo-endopeptidase [Rhizobium sp. rho-1.1]
MAKAQINPAMLAWASERAGLDAEAISERLKVTPDRAQSWLDGADKPTFRQAQQAASALHVPFGFLFLRRAPDEEMGLPDLRTVGGDPARNLDLNFRDLLRDVLFKRDWYRDYLSEIDGTELPFVGSFDVSADAIQVSESMKLVLFGPESEPPAAASWEAYLSALMKSAERAGIWVMRNGIVGSNTHRPLSVDQFRGFAISDRTVPLVFINGRDAKAAQIFTLAHELAHIWLGQSGVSNVNIGQTDYGTHRALERKCNAIAAEFLVPEARFLERWHADRSFIDNVDSNSRFFKVSRVVIARRAFDLGQCTDDQYGRFFASEAQRWVRDDEAGGGGDFYKVLPIRNGSRFTNSVVGEAASGRMLLRQAAALLNTQPAAIMKFHRKRQAA